MRGALLLNGGADGGGEDSPDREPRNRARDWRRWAALAGAVGAVYLAAYHHGAASAADAWLCPFAEWTAVLSIPTSTAPRELADCVLLHRATRSVLHDGLSECLEPNWTMTEQPDPAASDSG